jgi:hypothetical protein
MTPEAPSAATPGPARIALLDLPPGLAASDLADRLTRLPAEAGGLPRRAVQTAADGAAAIYLAGEESAQPQFGTIVVLIVPPREDAGAAVADLQRERWGDPTLQTVTASFDGDATTPAYREFWRTFPPGLFALPNQPVYFLLAYRAGSDYAFMIVASSPAIREALSMMLVQPP